MTENLELKLQSDNTSQEENDLDIQISQLAPHYHARVVLNKDDLSSMFDEVWEENAEFFVRKFDYRAKKKKGGEVDLSQAKVHLENTIGVKRLYGNSLSNYISTLVEKEADRKIMMVTDLHIHGWGSDEDVVGIIQYYYWPNIEFSKESVSFEMTRGVPLDKEEEFNNRCEIVRNQHREYSPTESITGEDQRVFVDIIVSSGDEPVDSLTQRGVWLDVDRLSPVEIKEAVLSHEKGDLFELEFDIDGDLHHAHVKIYDVNDIKYLDVDDPELYKKAGHESKEKFKELFSKQFDSFIAQQEKASAYNKVMTQIMQEATYEPIPQQWIVGNVNRFFETHVNSYRKDKDKALQAIGAKTEEEARRIFEGQVYKETITQMVIHWYADQFNCLPDPESVSNDAWSKAVWSD